MDVSESGQLRLHRETLSTKHMELYILETMTFSDKRKCAHSESPLSREEAHVPQDRSVLRLKPLLTEKQESQKLRLRLA